MIVVRTTRRSSMKGLLQRLAVGWRYCLHVWRLACVRVGGCVIEEEAAAIVMAHGAATGINLFWGAQAASLQFAAAANRFRSRSHAGERTSIRRSGRMQQASSLCSPESHRADRQLWVVPRTE
jgi:hypothetical protein